MSCPIAPDAPSLKDLPRVADDFKSELQGFKTDNLKHADTQKKVVLPSAEGLYTFFFICALFSKHLFISIT